MLTTYKYQANYTSSIEQKTEEEKKRSEEAREAKYLNIDPRSVKMREINSDCGYKSKNPKP